MTIIEFLFYLVAQFVTLKQGRMAEMQNDAEKWEAEHKEKNTKTGEWIKKGERWYVKLPVAVAAIFIIKWVGDWFYSSPAPEILEPEPTPQTHAYPRQKITLFDN